MKLGKKKLKLFGRPAGPSGRSEARVFLRVPARRLFGADAPNSLRTGTRKKTLKN